MAWLCPAFNHALSLPFLLHYPSYADAFPCSVWQPHPAQVQDIIATGLHEFVDAFQTKLNIVGDSIFATFFALRPIGGTVTLKASSQQPAVRSQRQIH